MSFVDIAGIVRGASEGQGLGNKFLANIREAEAICQVIRVFDDPDVVHVDGKISPKDDIETINTELILADLQTIEKTLPRLQKEARLTKGGSEVVAAVEEAKEVLDAGQTVFAAGLDLEPLRELWLLDGQALHLRLQPRRGRVRQHGAQGGDAGAGGTRPRPSSLTPRSRPSSSSCPTTRRWNCCSRSARTSRASIYWPASASTPSGCRPT